MALLKWINRHPKDVAVLSGVFTAAFCLWRVFSQGLAGLFHPVNLLVLPLPIILVALSLKGEAALIETALENCDPEPLLERSRHTLRTQDGRSDRSRRARFTALSNQMVALHAMGRFAEADDAARRLEASVSAVSPDIRLTFFLNLCSLRVDQQRMEEADACLAEVEALLAQASLQDMPPAGRFSLESNRLSLRTSFDTPEDVLASLLDLLERHRRDTLRTQVVAHYNVALTLLLLNRKAEALPYLRFVADNGGKLWQKPWAEAQLATPNTDPNTDPERAAKRPRDQSNKR